MSKIKKQAETEAPPAAAAADAAATAGAIAQAITGDGTGQALPEVDETNALREAPAIESQTAVPVPVPVPEPEPEPEVEIVDVLVLCAGNVAGIRYEAGIVLEDVPVNVAQAYAGMLDAHPDAAAYARARGAEVLAYEG